MINDDELTITDEGTHYRIGELKQRSEKLPYLRQGALCGFFEGVDGALDFLATKMASPKAEGSSAKYSSGFNTYKSYPEAVDVYRNHPEQINKFDEAELQLRDRGETGNEVEYDVTGDYIDMGRLMEGVPESFGQMHSGKARSRRLTIYVDTGQMGYVGEEVVNHRGERILRLVDAVENGGARSEIIAMASNTCGHFQVKLKHHDEPLSINDLAVVSHADWHRRMVFRFREYSKTFSYGYGRSTDLNDAIEPEMLESDNHEEVVIFMAGSIETISTVNSLFDKLERLLAWELGKPVPEVSTVKVEPGGIYFKDNGSRDSAEIQAEGQAILDE